MRIKAGPCAGFLGGNMLILGNQGSITHPTFARAPIAVAGEAFLSNVHDITEYLPFRVSQPSY